MARITFVLDDELETEYREAASKKYGLRKGSLSKFAEDAIRLLLKVIAEEER